MSEQTRELDHTSELKKEKETLSRRDFLKGLGVAGAALTTAAVVPSFLSEGKVRAEDGIEELLSQIESMSLVELEQAIFHEYPVIPDLEKIGERLKSITDISKGGTLMKSGTSVAWGMLRSIYGDNVNQESIDFGDEKYKLEKVLEYFQIPFWAIDICAISGVDIGQLIHDSYTCIGLTQEQRPFDVPPMPCLPNTGVNDSYIEHFKPDVALNFIGTNLIRHGTSLNDFALQVQELITYYLSNGIIPILTTFPQPKNSTDEVYKNWFEHPKLYIPADKKAEDVVNEALKDRVLFVPERAFKYNILLLKMAEMYQIPIINTERGAVERAQNDGIVTTEYGGAEIDPLHFSKLLDIPPFEMPKENEKFRYGEQTITYFTVQTLYELLKVMGK
ncbi:MAG: twin-arginine translocation signal domain-containing protein [Patescibacteria group bacterium]